MNCEDFPCCGHPRGQCEDRPEFTSEYWADLMNELDPDEYDAYTEILDRQEAGY